MKRLPISLLALSLATPVLVCSLPATAATAPAPALVGYQQVMSPVFTEPPGGHDVTFFSCPDGTNVIGGGTILFSTDPDQNIQDEGPAPNGQGYDARVNNNSTTDADFRIYAICATNVQNYSYVTGESAPHRAGTQATADATCPTGTVPFTGGGGTDLNDLGIRTNSSYPLGNGWRIKVNNATSEDRTINATVVCGNRPAGYQRITGTAVILKAATQGSASAACPSGTKVLSGGGRSSATSTSVDLNSSAPASNSAWQVFENNNSPRTNTLTAYAICARATRA